MFCFLQKVISLKDISVNCCYFKLVEENKMLAKLCCCSCDGRTKGPKKRKEKGQQPAVSMNTIIQQQYSDQSRTQQGQTFPALPPTPRPNSSKHIIKSCLMIHFEDIYWQKFIICHFTLNQSIRLVYRTTTCVYRTTMCVYRTTMCVYRTTMCACQRNNIQLDFNFQFLHLLNYWSLHCILLKR